MMPNHIYKTAEKFERDDIELVKMFLSQFKDEAGRSYTIKSRPDVEDRNAKAVEAIAIAEDGHTLAIEHTYIQPFEGQRADDYPFLAVFGQLREDAALKIPNRFIDVLVPAFAIQKGVDWNEIAKRVRQWFVDTATKFPVEGQTDYSIPGCGFDLNVVAHTFALPETDGVVVVGRILPSGYPFDAVLDKALGQKVPKLVATAADIHILLLEDGGTAIGFAKIGMGLDARVEKLAALKKVNAVWTIHTMEWKSKGLAMFVRVWPGGVGQRFWIEDERFSKSDSR
jgi:hypothetical protein